MSVYSELWHYYWNWHVSMEIAAPYMVLMSRSQERGCWRLIIKGDWLARAPHRGGGEEERGSERERKWEAKVIAKPSLALYWLEPPLVYSLQKMSIPISHFGIVLKSPNVIFFPSLRTSQKTISCGLEWSARFRPPFDRFVRISDDGLL